MGASEVDDFGLQIHNNSLSLVMEQIQKWIAGIQAQISALSTFKADKSAKPKSTKNHKKEPTLSQPSPQKQSPGQQGNPRPRPGYCFKCGEDGYIATTRSNPTLIEAKKKELTERDKKNTLDNLQTNNSSYEGNEGNQQTKKVLAKCKIQTSKQY